MDLEYEQFEVIEAYINEELSANDAAHFEKQMATDSELALAVNEYKKIKVGLRALAIERQLESIANNHKKQTILKPIWQRYVTIAASIILFISFGIWGGIKYFNYKQAESLFADNYSLKDSEFTYKSLPEQNNKNDEELQDAIKNIKNNNINEAIVTLNHMPESGRYLYFKKYYLGLSYLAKDQTNLAIKNLIIASKTKENTLRYKAQWYLALAYLKNRDKQKSIGVLSQLKQTDNEYQQKAANLYIKLKK